MTPHADVCFDVGHECEPSRRGSGEQAGLTGHTRRAPTFIAEFFGRLPSSERSSARLEEHAGGRRGEMKGWGMGASSSI